MKILERFSPVLTIAIGLFPAVAAPILSAAAQPAVSDSVDNKKAPWLDELGKGFRTRKTDHFLIAYDTSYDDLRPLIGRLEGTYNVIRLFCEKGGLGVEEPTSLLPVILFDRFDEFQRFSAGVGFPAQSVAGFFQHKTNLAVFLNARRNPDINRIRTELDQTRSQWVELREHRDRRSDGRRRRRDLQRKLSTLQTQYAGAVKRFNRFVIQHEAAHQILFNFGIHRTGVDNPTWLVEGLACQFEVPQAGHHGDLTRVNTMRLADFRDALRAKPGEKSLTKDQYAAAIDSGRLVPVRDFISRPSLFAIGDGKITFRYAQAWSLVYYLHHKYRQPFAAYLKLLRRRQPGIVVSGDRAIAEFRSIFAEPDRDWEQSWINYMLRLPFNPHAAGP